MPEDALALTGGSTGGLELPAVEAVDLLPEAGNPSKVEEVDGLGGPESLAEEATGGFADGGGDAGSTDVLVEAVDGPLAPAVDVLAGGFAGGLLTVGNLLPMPGLVAEAVDGPLPEVGGGGPSKVEATDVLDAAVEPLDDDDILLPRAFAVAAASRCFSSSTSVATSKAGSSSIIAR